MVCTNEALCLRLGRITALANACRSEVSSSFWRPRFLRRGRQEDATVGRLSCLEVLMLLRTRLKCARRGVTTGSRRHLLCPRLRATCRNGPPQKAARPDRRRFSESGTERLVSCDSEVSH